MSRWYPVGLPIRDFVSSFKPGMVIEVEAENGPQLHLIGTMSPDGSVCHGCYRPEYDTELVIRYRMIHWEKP